MIKFAVDGSKKGDKSRIFESSPVEDKEYTEQEQWDLIQRNYPFLLALYYFKRRPWKVKL